MLQHSLVLSDLLQKSSLYYLEAEPQAECINF